MQASRVGWTGCSGAASAARERRSRAFTPRRPRVCVAEAGDNAHLGNGASTSSSSGAAAAGSGSSVPAASSSSLSSSEDGWAPSAAACSTAKGGRRSTMGWPQKSELYLLRSDGVSCTRETVQRELLPRCRCCCSCFLGAGSGSVLGVLCGLCSSAQHCLPCCALRNCRLPAPWPSPVQCMRAASGNLQFACPSSQQQLLVWKTKPKRCAAAAAATGACLSGWVPLEARRTAASPLPAHAAPPYVLLCMSQACCQPNTHQSSLSSVLPLSFPFLPLPSFPSGLPRPFLRSSFSCFLPSLLSSAAESWC